MVPDQQACSSRRHPERSRELILRAATELFAEQGFAATTLAQIGLRAGLSRGTPGYFFGAKDELYRTVLDRSFLGAKAAMTADASAAEARGESGEDVFRSAIGAYIDFLASHPEFVRLVEWEALGHGRALRETTPHLDMVMAALSAIGETLADQLPPGFDTTQLMLSIAGLCWFPLAHHETLGRVLQVDPFAPEFIEARKQHVIELVLSGVGGACRH